MSRCAARNKYDIAKFPGLHPLCRGRKSGVEAPVKTDLELDAGGVQRLNDLDRHISFQRNRLLTEHVLARLSRAQSQLGVGIRRRGDDDAVEGRIGQELVIGGQAAAPSWAETCFATSGRGSKTASNWAEGHLEARFCAWTTPMRPSPATARPALRPLALA